MAKTILLSDDYYFNGGWGKYRGGDNVHLGITTNITGIVPFYGLSKTIPNEIVGIVEEEK